METKIIYYIGDETTPYLIKIPNQKVKLGDFKNALKRQNYKYFFKSMDGDFGIVKEEIVDNEVYLPCFNGRVVSWLVMVDSCNHSDTQSQIEAEHNSRRISALSDADHLILNCANATCGEDDVGGIASDTDSVSSTHQDRVAPLHDFNEFKRLGHLSGKVQSNRSPINMDLTTSSSMMSSDLDSTSYFDSEDDECSRLSTTTGTTMSYKKVVQCKQRRLRHRRLPPAITRASSFSSMTESSVSLNIVEVTLDMISINFLGISIVGQSNKEGDGGIYVGNIMPDGAVAADGRIQPGDMILQVNGIDFEHVNNDEAVRLVRQQVQKPGPITLLVAKCWQNARHESTLPVPLVPRGEPVRPIDPRAWIMHTNALIQAQGSNFGSASLFEQARQQRRFVDVYSLSTLTSTSSSLASSLPEAERYTSNQLLLTVDSDMATIVRVMMQFDSGLPIRDRMWLKITIPNAFIGSDLVDWLYGHVDGFLDRRDARKFACKLLKAGYIRHTVNKVSFSQQCYYVFADLSAVLFSISLDDVHSISDSMERDTLAPLPPPSWSHATLPGAAQSTYLAYGFGGPTPDSFCYSTDSTSQYSSLPLPSSLIGPVSGQFNPTSSSSDSDLSRDSNAVHNPTVPILQGYMPSLGIANGIIPSVLTE